MFCTFKHLQALEEKKFERLDLPTTASAHPSFASVFPNKPHRDAFESACPSGFEHRAPKFI